MSNFNTFMSLVRDGDVKDVVSTFQTEYLSMTEEDGITPLHKACARGDLKLVELLCDTSNIETHNKYNCRPIHVACICGHLGVVEYLHQRGCDIEAPGNFGSRPLHLASEHGWLDVVKYLCSHQCESDATNDDLWRPIHFACRGGHFEIVKFLCEQNGDIEVSTLDNFRPIHLACKHGHLEIVRFLCEKNCDIEVSTSDNVRPIHLACMNGHLEIVRFLREQMCDIEASTSGNYRPVHLACQHGYISIVAYLFQQKCNMEAVTKFRYQPIHVAIINGHIDIVRYLVQQRGEVEAVTKIGEFELNLAIRYGRHDIIKFLSDESSKRQLIRKIADMKMECDDDCDHSFCITSVCATISKSDDVIFRGGLGCLFKMEDPGLKYTFCMKSIYLDEYRNFNKRNHIELNINKYLDVLHHERIVQYFGTIDNGKDMYIFLEYVEGMTLEKHINQKPLSHNKAIQYSKEILEGLKFLHQKKIIHRDIKTDKIMVNVDGHVKICGLGLSCCMESIGEETRSDSTDSSSKMTICGTPNYMAPELVTGEKYSYPVDIWALGASVVEMLTGKRPFHGLRLFEIIFTIGTKQKIEFVPAEPMSEDMKSFVDQMLCPCPSTRATAEMLLDFIGERFSSSP